MTTVYGPDPSASEAEHRQWAADNNVDLSAIHPMLIREWCLGRRNPRWRHLFQPRPQRDPDAPVAATDDPRAAAYAAAALESTRAELSEMQEGSRTVEAYRRAFRLGTFVAAGYLERDAVWNAVWDASVANGVVAKKGPRIIETQIRNGLDHSAHIPAEIVLDNDDTYPEAYVMEAPTTRQGLLPETFWAASERLQAIRRAAHNGACGADAVLACVLARLAAALPHGARAATPGISTGDLSLNLFVALLGHPESGKSTAHQIARRLVPLGPDRVRSTGRVASGEAIAEAFMGDGRDSDGSKKRMQVRHNAFAYIDEGEALMRSNRNETSTAMSALRSAFFAEDLGTQNATSDRTRHVPAESYNFGLVVGFQEGKLDDLLADTAGGTPQRFLYVQTADPGIPDPDPEAIENATGPLPTWPDIITSRTRITLPREVMKRIQADRLRRVRGELRPNEWERHLDAKRIKVAGLLAALHGHTTVSDALWEAAVTLVDTSQANLRRMVRDKAAREHDRIERQASREALAEEYRDTKRAERVEKVAARIVEKVTGWDRDKWGPPTRRSVLNRLSKESRPVFTEALDHALGQDLIGEDGAELCSRP